MQSLKNKNLTSSVCSESTFQTQAQKKNVSYAFPCKEAKFIN